MEKNEVEYWVKQIAAHACVWFKQCGNGLCVRDKQCGNERVKSSLIFFCFVFSFNYLKIARSIYLLIVRLFCLGTKTFSEVNDDRIK